ncbi:hypothetical protein OROGR_009064 [Orobanche gracilis]
MRGKIPIIPHTLSTLLTCLSLTSLTYAASSSLSLSSICLQSHQHHLPQYPTLTIAPPPRRPSSSAKKSLRRAPSPRSQRATPTYHKKKTVSRTTHHHLHVVVAHLSHSPFTTAIAKSPNLFLFDDQAVRTMTTFTPPSRQLPAPKTRRCRRLSNLCFPYLSEFLDPELAELDPHRKFSQTLKGRPFDTTGASVKEALPDDF